MRVRQLFHEGAGGCSFVAMAARCRETCLRNGAGIAIGTGAAILTKSLHSRASLSAIIRWRDGCEALWAPGHGRDCWIGVCSHGNRSDSGAGGVTHLMHSAQRADAVDLIPDAGSLALVGAVVSLYGGGFSAGVYRLVDCAPELAAHAPSLSVHRSGVRPSAQRLFVFHENWRPRYFPSGEAGDSPKDEAHQCEDGGDDGQEGKRDCGQGLIPVEPGQGDVPLSRT